MRDTFLDARNAMKDAMIYLGHDQISGSELDIMAKQHTDNS